MGEKQQGAGTGGAPFQIPADLSSLNLEQLDELIARANGEVDAILDGGKQSADLPRMTQLAKAIKAINTRKSEIETEAAETEAKFAELLDEIRPAKPAESAPAVEPAAAAPAASGDDTGEVIEGELVDAAPQTVAASGTRPQGGAHTAARELGGLRGGQHKLNPSLSAARVAAPTPMTTPSAEPLDIIASAGLPGQFDPGARIDSMKQLGALAENKARSMADQGGKSTRRRGDAALYLTVDDGADYRDGTRRHHSDPYGGIQVASIRNNYGADVFGPKTSVDTIDAWMEKVNSRQGASAMESLVAAGGWCAPAQIRYDFFNIAAECGMIDLPTFGVERGGIQFPVSPSLADTFSPALPWYTAFSNATVPWLWQNVDDILSVTGSPLKPCIRVPCSTMSTAILECYGICLTAGNLADNAWPESTRNFLKLLMSAHYHASNARYISTIQGLATGLTSCSVTGQGFVAPVLYTAEMAAVDTRTKFGMCSTDVIEQVYPEWALVNFRADISKRTGIEPGNGFTVSNADIMNWFDVRGIRAQFVQDYQVRAAGQFGASAGITTLPQQVKFLNYAAGTVARGNGMTLDLGVVRDSTLNAKNDFTAAWMEECHLIAKIGHEVREYTVNACPDGTTGAADITACC